MGVFRACVWHRLCNGKAFSGQQDLTPNRRRNAVYFLVKACCVLSVFCWLAGRPGWLSVT